MHKTCQLKLPPTYTQVESLLNYPYPIQWPEIINYNVVKMVTSLHKHQGLSEYAFVIVSYA